MNFTLILESSSIYTRTACVFGNFHQRLWHACITSVQQIHHLHVQASKLLSYQIPKVLLDPGLETEETSEWPLKSTGLKHGAFLYWKVPFRRWSTVKYGQQHPSIHPSILRITKVHLSISPHGICNHSIQRKPSGVYLDLMSVPPQLAVPLKASSRCSSSSSYRSDWAQLPSRGNPLRIDSRETFGCNTNATVTLVC